MMNAKYALTRCLRPVCWSLAFLTAGSFTASAQSQRTHEQLIRADRLSETQAIEYLYAMRTSSFAESYVFRFQIKHYPYRARSFSYHGTLYGQIDPLTGEQRERIVIQQRDPEQPRQSVTLRDLLLVRGPQPHAWVAQPEQIPAQHSAQNEDPTSLPTSQTDTDSPSTSLPKMAQLDAPVLEGISLTPFDLLVPYFYWNRFEYRGPEQVKARPTQSFRLHSPNSDFPIQTVEVELDDEFRAVLKATYLGADGNPLKSMELIAFKKTGDTYIPKTLDYRESGDRGDKTRIDIIAAAMEVDLPSELFEPDNVGQELPSIDPFIYDVF